MTAITCGNVKPVGLGAGGAALILGLYWTPGLTEDVSAPAALRFLANAALMNR